MLHWFNSSTCKNLQPLTKAISVDLLWFFFSCYFGYITYAKQKKWINLSNLVIIFLKSSNEIKHLKQKRVRQQGISSSSQSYVSYL